MEFDYNRVAAFMRWTTRRFKDKTVEQVWGKIQEDKKLMREYQGFDQQAPRYALSSVSLEFCLKNYGWKDFMRAMWIMASKKEETMHQLGFTDEEAKWCKVKDKLASIPKNVQL